MSSKHYTILQALRNGAVSTYAGIRRCHWTIRFYDLAIFAALIVSIGVRL